jgi:hypothetical protein
MLVLDVHTSHGAHHCAELQNCPITQSLCFVHDLLPVGALVEGATVGLAVGGTVGMLVGGLVGANVDSCTPEVVTVDASVAALLQVIVSAQHRTAATPVLSLKHRRGLLAACMLSPAPV